LLYAGLFHFAAGVVTGSVYKIYVLVILLALVAIESAVALMTYGWWALANPALLQIGYLAGAFTRDFYETGRYANRSMRIRRLP
jgi:hypothetical protein